MTHDEIDAIIKASQPSYEGEIKISPKAIIIPCADATPEWLWKEAK